MNFADKTPYESDQNNQWVRTTRTLAKQAGCEQVIEPMLSCIFGTQRETINIAVIGSPNSGKSCRINALIGRKVIPVSGVASNCSFIIQSTHNSENERFSIANTSGMLTDLITAIESNHSNNQKEYQVSINSDWLAADSIQLIEKPALDAIDEELNVLIEECLNGVDIVILLIDALMPIKRSELEFINVCVQHKLPLIVAISKLDKISDDEQEDVVAYVTKHLEICKIGIPVIDTRITSELTCGIEELKQTIKQCFDKMDLNEIRQEEVRYALRIALETIKSAVQAKIEMQLKNEVEIDDEIKQRQQKIETMSLEWIKLNQMMHQRRQKLDDQIRNFLNENQNTVLERLLYELERNNDVKTWWQRDLPYRLQLEIKSVANQLSTSINKTISNDVKWIQEELLRQLKVPLPFLIEPVFSIEKFELAQKELPLSDSRRFRIISRFGTATSVLMAGLLLTTSGLVGTTLAVSTLAGLTMEEIADFNTKKNRNVVRGEIKKLVQQASHEYATEVSRRLRAGYDEIVAVLKQYQESWQQAQLQSVMLYAQKKMTDTNWQDMLCKVNTLINEIEAK